MKEVIIREGQAARPRRHRLLYYGSVLLTGIIFFCVSSPTKHPSFLLVVGFIVLAAVIYSLVSMCMEVTGLREKVPAPYRQGIVLTAVSLPVLLSMMQSTGQLTVRDGLVLGILFLLGVFYVGRLRGRKATV